MSSINYLQNASKNNSQNLPHLSSIRETRLCPSISQRLSQNQNNIFLPYLQPLIPLLFPFSSKLPRMSMICICHMSSLFQVVQLCFYVVTPALCFLPWYGLVPLNPNSLKLSSIFKCKF